MDVENILTPDQRIRLRCAEITGDSASVSHVANAISLYQFITGANDKTPLEKVTEALREAGLK